MLKEIKKVRQIQGEANRRWFNSEEMDLIIWHESGKIVGFQLCYDKKEQEKALSWKPEADLIHQKVDDGESRDGHYKATPILIKNGEYDLKSLKQKFENDAQNIEEVVKQFVLQRL